MRRYILQFEGSDPQVVEHNELVVSADASVQSLTRWLSGDFLQAGGAARAEILRRLREVSALLGEVDRRVRGGSEPAELGDVERGLSWLLDGPLPECRHCQQSAGAPNDARAEAAERCPGHQALAALRRLRSMVIGADLDSLAARVAALSVDVLATGERDEIAAELRGARRP